MSKSVTLAAVALLSLSFLSPTVQATTSTGALSSAVSTATTTMTAAEFARLSQSLMAKLKTLSEKGDELPVNDANHKLLTETLSELDDYLKVAKTFSASDADVTTLTDFRQLVVKLLTLQYEVPTLFNQVLTQVPKLEEQRQDEAVDFDEFDKILEDLLKAVDQLEKLLPTISADYDDQEDYQKDVAYLKAVKSYVQKLQEELYAADSDKIDVPATPVYWGTLKTSASSSTGTSSSSSSTTTATSSSSSTQGTSTTSSSSTLATTATSSSTKTESADEEDKDGQSDLASSGSTGSGTGGSTTTRRILPKTGEASAVLLTAMGVLVTVVSVSSWKRRQASKENN